MLYMWFKVCRRKALNIQHKTHEKSKIKNKMYKRTEMPDFEKPDFSQIM